MSIKKEDDGEEELAVIVKYSTDFTEITLTFAGESPITPDEFMKALAYFQEKVDAVALFSDNPYEDQSLH